MPLHSQRSLKIWQGNRPARMFKINALSIRTINVWWTNKTHTHRHRHRQTQKQRNENQNCQSKGKINASYSCIHPDTYTVLFLEFCLWICVCDFSCHAIIMLTSVSSICLSHWLTDWRTDGVTYVCSSISSSHSIHSSCANIILSRGIVVVAIAIVVRRLMIF